MEKVTGKRAFSRCQKVKAKHTETTLDGGPRKRRVGHVTPSTSTRTTSQPQASTLTIPEFQLQDIPEPVPLPPVTTYTEQRRKELDSWIKVRDQLFATNIELSAPLCHTCSICGKGELGTFYRCRECGPTAVFCTTCLEQQHRNSFHIPEIWESDSFRLRQHNNSMQLPHHDGCDGRYRKPVKVFDAE
ncbi:uncharacterized protein LOC144868145, partial [Branchiostoma floridae x Branchiostoma japonicum]